MAQIGPVLKVGPVSLLLYLNFFRLLEYKQARYNLLHCETCTHRKYTMAIESLRLNLDKLLPANTDSNVTSHELPPLLRLPVELHLEIVSYLSGDHCCRVFDSLALRLVNRYFYYGLDAPSHEQLLSLETTECGFAYQVCICKYCLCLRRADKFAKNITRIAYS